MLLIHDRDRWELPPEPEPTAARRELHLPRPTKRVLKALLAVVLFVVGAIAPGIIGAVVLVAALVALWSAAGTALPYGLGLKEYRQ